MGQLFNDGIKRFKDPENGLWKRYQQWGSNGIDKDTNKLKIKKGFEPESGEILVDKIGEYCLLVNGLKVYSFPKPKKEEVVV